MSRRHYIPVAAKREALRMYRDRRRNGEGPWHSQSLTPADAMRSVVTFYASWIAHFVAYKDDADRLKDLVNEYRAAQYYLQIMYRKPWRNSWSGRVQPASARRSRLTR